MARGESKKSSKAVTFIGRGTTLAGEIRAHGGIHIEGDVSGHVESEASIVIHSGARVKANLIAPRIIVSGYVEGNLTAHERIECTSTAKIVGDISAPRIAMSAGVVFEGRCTMDVAGKSPAPIPQDVAQPELAGVLPRVLRRANPAERG